MSNIYHFLPKPTWEDYLSGAMENVEILLESITEEENAAYHSILEQVMFSLTGLERELEGKDVKDKEGKGEVK